MTEKYCKKERCKDVRATVNFGIIKFEGGTKKCIVKKPKYKC